MITLHSEWKYYCIISPIYIQRERERERVYMYSTTSTGQYSTVHSGPNIVSRAGRLRERRQQTPLLAWEQGNTTCSQCSTSLIDDCLSWKLRGIDLHHLCLTWWRGLHWPAWRTSVRSTLLCPPPGPVRGPNIGRSPSSLLRATFTMNVWSSNSTLTRSGLFKLHCHVDSMLHWIWHFIEVVYLKFENPKIYLSDYRELYKLRVYSLNRLFSQVKSKVIVGNNPGRGRGNWFW